METRMTAAHKPAVTIAVLTFNRARRLRELLAALAPLVGADVELIVVDNHSQDETAEVVRTCGVDVDYVRTDANIGVAARNLGLRRALGEVVVCLDDDVFGIDRAALDTIQAAFAADPRLAAINFKVLDPWTGGLCNWVHHCEEERFADRTFDTYEITEGAVAFRRVALAEAGWYPESFFLSHEGPDLAFRLLDRGYKVIYRGDISVQHWHDKSGRKSWMVYYYDTRNQYWLAVRNFPAGYALRYLARGQVSTCVYALRDGYLRHWLRAVRDGVLGMGPMWRDRRTVTATTLAAITAMDARRPSLLYMARKRLFRRDMRL
jgi:GT2 family glycosyltransferase